MRSTALVLLLLLSFGLQAQDNYEIQVYSSPTMDKGQTMIEWHSNYTVHGFTQVDHGVRPDNHSYHGTLEITHGFTNHFEIGWYLFTNATSPYGWQVIGTHLRPRVSVPDSWHWPFGASLSTEFGYQRSTYSTETWNIEFRPILDKQVGKWYFCLNPALGFQFTGTVKEKGPAFAPNIKTAFNLSDKVSLGAEYYGDLGPINSLERGPNQSHTIYAVADLYLSPVWEINFGPGWGLTPATDGLVLKLILGRRIQWHKKTKPVAGARPVWPGHLTAG